MGLKRHAIKNDQKKKKKKKKKKCRKNCSQSKVVSYRHFLHNFKVTSVTVKCTPFPGSTYSYCSGEMDT